MEHLNFDDNLLDEGLVGGKFDAAKIQELYQHLQRLARIPWDGLKRTPERIAACTPSYWRFMT